MTRTLGTATTLAIAILACGGEPAPEPTPQPPAATPAESPVAAWFVDVTDDARLDFRHQGGAGGNYLMPEIMGAGGALFDYDGDGDLDLYLVDGGVPFGAGRDNRMYRHEANGTFRDVTASSGLGDPGYGMGATLGDVDNDGDLDLLATNFGADSLYRNQGGGLFQRSAVAGFDDDLWTASACFLDHDADGWLDLYVTTYVAYDSPRACSDRAGHIDYCGPKSFRGLRDRLYRNLGRAAGGGWRGFADVSDAALPDRPANRGLGLICADLDGDGRTDVYVANDGETNQLWHNRGDGGFEERALVLGAAVNMFSKPEASMGVAAGDVDGDLDLDLFMTHLDRETDTLYVNLGEAGFEDRTSAAGLAVAGLSRTGFGTALLDLDLDADLDLLALNGRVSRGPSPSAERRAWWLEADLSEWLTPYAEPNLLFLNDGRGRFLDAGARGGRLTAGIEIGRGLLPGDLDGDGDLDLVTTANGGRARIWRNQAPRGGGWLRLRALDPATGRDALGASVTVLTDRGELLRPVVSTVGYLTAVEPELHFGLGPAERIERIRVHWPDGARESFPGGPPDRTVVVRKGEGAPG